MGLAGWTATDERIAIFAAGIYLGGKQMATIRRTGLPFRLLLSSSICRQPISTPGCAVSQKRH